MNKKYLMGAMLCSSLILSGYTTISSDTNIQKNESEELQSTQKTETSETSNESTSETNQGVESNATEVSGTEPSETEISKEEIITEEMNRPMGFYAKEEAGISSRSLIRSDTISATEANRPPKSFVDVSSWNGSISLQHYEIMKNFGVAGAVVKLTEGETYKNPERTVQIRNAQEKGIKVSAYHFSHFRTKAEAIAEANYFADTAIEMGLSKDTIMVNDAEDSKLNNGQATSNSLAFAEQLNKRGFNNVLHYSMASWFTGANPVLNPAVLGAQNIWIAHYLYNPTQDNLLYKNDGFSAWQWGSTLVFPGVSVGVGVFDINTDYLGMFTGGKNYDSILEQNQYTYSARVLSASESRNYGVYNGVENTGPGVSLLGNGDMYADQKVTILASARTNRSTYLKFYANGTSAWMDSRAFKPELDTATVESTKFIASIKSVAESGKHGLYTEPNNTSEQTLKLGTGSLYANQTVEVVNTAKISTGVTAYQFTVNGQLIGWLDSRAFTTYDSILEQNQYTYTARVTPASQSKGHGVYDDVNNTKPGVKLLGMGDRYADQKVTILASARTNRSTYLKFYANGTSAWMDSRAFKPELDTATVESTKFIASIKSVAESGKHGLYTEPNNTSEQTLKLGTGSLYANQTVEVVNTAKISTGVTAYQFTINGQLIGWLDSRAFTTYDSILEQNQYTYTARVTPASQSKGHGVYDDVNNIKPGVKLLGMGDRYADQKVTILASARTNRSTYLKFYANGTSAWMDSRAFKPELDTVTSEKVSIKTNVKPFSEAAKHGLYTEPNNTSLKVQKIGLGSNYADQAVELIKKGKISNGVVVYQFKINNQIIGWMDSRAFNF